MNKLEHKTALITGGGRGIGRATAELFAQNGAKVIIAARTESELRETAANCSKAGVKVLWKPVDLGKPEQIDLLFEEIEGAFPSLDILINNAAKFDSGLMSDYDIARFRNMLDLNLIAPFYLSQKAVAMMNPKSGGSIVNISSFSGCFNTVKFPGFGAYNISKYGLWGLTEILAIELKSKNIRVNQVSPSGVDTRMFEQAVPPGLKAEYQPVDIARKILELVSDESSGITGQNIMMPEPPMS